MSTRFRIKELRQQKGFTQIQFSAMMGVQHNTVSQWETGCRNPSSSILPHLADILGCTIDELYEHDLPIGTSQSSA